MRIFADINRIGSDPRDFVIQVSPDQETTVMNGKFVIDVPDGVTPPLEIPSDVSTLNHGMTEQFLARYPRYQFIEMNWLCTDNDSAKLDLAASLTLGTGPTATSWPSRAQVGRNGAMSHNGMAPNSACVLPVNTGVTPVRPGVLITDTIDVSGDRPDGVSDVMLYWRVFQFTTSHDVMNYATGANSPAVKTLTEPDQSLADLEVYVSVNDGAGYVKASRLQPTTPCDSGSSIRVAFVNHGATPLYLAAYAVLY